MASQERLKQIFVGEAGEPVEFYIHQSVKEEKREKIIKAIERYGGEVVDTDRGVDTVVVDPRYPNAYTLQNKYKVHSDRRYWDTRVEDTQFVFNCIKLGMFKHLPVKRQPMRGNRMGRNKYTKEDEKKLCRYLAIRTPNPESGGRLGHKIYADLVHLGIDDPKEYAWTLRHPAESWREHYRSKRNRTRLDVLIRRYALRLDPTEDQLYPFDRRLNRTRLPHYNEHLEQHQQENFDEYWQQRNGRMRTSQIGVRQEEEESSEEGLETERSDDEYHRPSADEEADTDGASQGMNARNVSTRRYIPNEPDNSQATLVGQGSTYKSPIQPLRISGEAVLPQTDEEDHEEEQEQEAERQSKSFPDATAVVIRAETHQKTVPPVAQFPVQKLSKQTGRPVQVASVDDAPYRNTRARSVAEPLLMIESQPRRQKRNAVEPSLYPPAEAEEESTKTIPNVNRIEEAKSGDLVRNFSRSKRQKAVEEFPTGNKPDTASVPETLHEEADVARLLAVESIGSSARSSIQRRQQPMLGHFPLSGKSRNTGSLRNSLHYTQPMDTDDEQIDKKLNSSNVPLWAKSNDDAHNPLHLLEGFNNSRPNGRATQPLLTEKTGPTDDFLETPSEYSFPLPGTRAQVVKKRYEEERKKEEYIPPPRTRASKRLGR